MEIHQFEALQAIVKQGSFRAAAESLNKAQSAVSYSIKSMEEQLGFALFKKEGSRKVLTAAGSAVYRKAQSLLLELEELQLLGKQLAQKQEPIIRLDLTPTLPMEHVTPVFARIGKQYPATQLVISIETFGGETLVKEGLVDIALTDVVDRFPELEYLPWAKIRFIPVVAPSHPLAAMEEVGLPKLVKFVQIIVSSKLEELQERTQGVLDGNYRWRVADFHTKLLLIEQGLGWGHMPFHMIQQSLKAGSLVQIKTRALQQEEANTCLVRKRRRHIGPVSTQLWHHLGEVALGKI